MAIKQTKLGNELDASLSAIVEAVLRAGTTDHGKLVSTNNHPHRVVG